MKLFTRWRRPVEPFRVAVAARAEGDDDRLFVTCPTCRAVFFSGFAGRGDYEITGHTTHCPNDHLVTFALYDLFYLDGTRPRKAHP